MKKSDIDISNFYPITIYTSKVILLFQITITFLKIEYLYIKKTNERLKQFIKTKLREFLNENIGDERRGIGNFLKTDDYNITIKKLPNYLMNIHDSVVNYWEETHDVFNYEKKELDKNKTLFSTQKYVSKSFIDNINDDIYNKSDITLCEDKKGNLWLLDGHHRLIYDRINLKNSFVYIIPFGDIKEIDYLFYGIDD